jgi:hypothetical protein
MEMMLVWSHNDGEGSGECPVPPGAEHLDIPAEMYVDAVCADAGLDPRDFRIVYKESFGFHKPGGVTYENTAGDTLWIALGTPENREAWTDKGFKVGDEFDFGLAAEFGYPDPVIGKIVKWSIGDPSFAVIAIPPGFDAEMAETDPSHPEKYAKSIREDGWLVMGCDTDFLFPKEWATEPRELREFKYFDPATGETVVTKSLVRAGAPR